MIERPPLDKATQLAYGVGAIAYGIKDNGFAYFLLLFYGTVVGLEPALAGIAVFIALVFDAVSDPLVGYWSDNTRSRWGRRHPFMYASALPVALCYFLLWRPPDWGEHGLFLYLVILAALIRTLITFFETPSSALMPELTRDYDERTRVQAWRSFFGWLGGSGLAIFMFGFLLVPTDEFPVGTLNRDGYEAYGVIAGVLIFFAIVISALGTHHRIPYLHVPAVRQQRELRQIYRDLRETLLEKSFGALFIASIAGAVATGLYTALVFLLLTYFWQFSSEQIFYWLCLVPISAGMGLFIAPKVGRRLGKKRAVLVLGAIAFTVQPLPLLGRLLGVLPENGDPLLFPLVAGINTLDLGFIIALQALLASMLADLVDHGEARTGRRSEGVFYAALTFIRKTNQGIGAFIAGLLLQWVAFPDNAIPGEVSVNTLNMLAATMIPALWGLWSAMLWSVSRYQIDRAGHEANLRALAEQP